MKPHYTITISLSEGEKNKVEALREKGATLIQIFKAGVEKIEKMEGKEST